MEKTAVKENKPSLTARNWTEGPIAGNLLLLSWPMVVMEGLYVLSQLVDMIWIGRLGPSAIAGVGIANIVIMMVMAMDFGIIIGVRAMVARYVGANDIAGANHIAAQAIILSVAWGGLMTLIMTVTGQHIMGLFGLEPDVVAEGNAYLRISFYGWIAMDLLVINLYIMQSAGDTIRPMFLEAAIRVVHIALAPFLVLGLWIFPPLGVSGAALSNVVSQALGGCIGLYILLSGRTRLHVHLSDFRLDLGIIYRIFRIGIPALIMNVQRSIGQFLLTLLIAPFGTMAVAAHSLAARVEMFVFLPGMGLGNGAGVLVGQNLGAGQPQRAERSAWTAVGILQALMVVVCAALLIWAEPIIRVFTSDPELIEIGALFIRIATPGFFFIGFTSVLQNCIATAGDTVPNMVISLVMLWIIEMPMAYFLPKYTDIGVLGIRWALVAGILSGSAMYFVYFRLGRWKRKKI